MIEQLKEPFEQQLNQRLSMLQSASDEMDAHKDIIRQWPTRKKRVTESVLDTLGKWSKDMKQMTRPFNLKKFRRMRKRMMRARYSTWFQGPGLMAKLKIAFLESINILRILLVLAVFIGIVVLLIFLIGKLVGAIGNWGKILGDL